MGIFENKVAVVTGAGRGIGRCDALLLASEGARVVVNDLGCDTNGEGSDPGPADEVVAEIRKAGNEAVANYDDVSTFKGGESLISQAIDEFGGLDVLINNAGVLRDRMAFNMSELEWDAVVDIVMKGHFCPIRHALAYWRGKNKETGEPTNGAIVNTASESGLYGNVGQLNYNAGKAGIASMTLTVAREGQRIGVRCNAITPTAGTRLLAGVLPPRAEDDDSWNAMAPDNVAPMVAWLASDLSSGVNGQVIKIGGGKMQLLKAWHPITEILADHTWTISEIDTLKPQLFARSASTDVFPFMPPVE
jgi:NAD(P)-dependent dehydrogenase (short-subunit alcohol dehydrogenase family)